MCLISYNPLSLSPSTFSFFTFHFLSLYTPPHRVWNNDIYLSHHINSRVIYAHHKQAREDVGPASCERKKSDRHNRRRSFLRRVGESFTPRRLDDFKSSFSKRKMTSVGPGILNSVTIISKRTVSELDFRYFPWDRFDSPYDHAHHKDVHGAMKNLFRKENVVVVEGAQHQNFGQNSNGNEEEKEEEKSNAEKNMTTEKKSRSYGVSFHAREVYGDGSNDLFVLLASETQRALH